MSPITRVTNATFDETFDEKFITPANFENNTAIQTIILLFISIVLFFTLPEKMLAVQKKIISTIYHQETSISSPACGDQHAEQTLVCAPNYVPSNESDL